MFLSSRDQEGCCLTKAEQDLEEVRRLVKLRSADDVDVCTHAYCYISNRVLRSKALNNGYAILRDSIQHGYVKVATVMLNFGAYVNDARSEGVCTPLHHAVRGGYKTIVELLLSKGAIVNVVNARKETPLHVAAQEKMTEIVKLLLSNNAKVNELDDTGESALHRAVRNGSEDIVRALLSMPGIEINRKLYREKGKTPLHLAIENGSERCALAVMEHGADINLADDTGGTPLYYAANNDLRNVVSALLGQGAAVNSVNNRKRSPLHLAVEKGHKSVVSILLKHSAKTDLQDDPGQTPLHVVAQKGCDQVSGLFIQDHGINADNAHPQITLEQGLSIVSELLDYGAGPNIRDNDGNTALLIASAFGNGRYVSLLLENAAEVNLKNNLGNSALHYAASLKTYRVDLITALLTYGADVNCKNSDLKTPLHVAADLGDGQCVTVLLEHGAEVNLKDSCSSTALHYAASRRKNYAGLIRTLLNYGGAVNSTDRNGKTALHIAASVDNERCAPALLEAGSQIDVKDNDGNSALHCAVMNRCDDTTLCLLSRGADANCKNGVGKSVLLIAVEGAFRSTVSILLKHVAIDVNAKNFSGDTPLHYAAKKGDLDTVIDLLTHGADIDCRNMAGETALYVATVEGHLPVVQALLDNGADVNITREWPALTLLEFLHQHSMSGNILEVFLQHIAVLKSLNIPVNIPYFRLIQRSRLEHYYSKCLEELSVLKISRLENGPDLSLYDMLVLKHNDLRVLVYNKVVLEYFTNEDYIPFTHMFTKRFALQFRLAKERATLLQEFSYFIGELFSIPPGICVDAITDYLSNRDLQSFILSCRIIVC